MDFDLPLILASRSPRRKQLLTDSGFNFAVSLPDEAAEDDRLPNELPEQYVRRLAFQKAENVAQKIDRGIVLGCDTIVLCNEKVLEKPTDRNDARRMIQMLRGQVHAVLSGICLIRKRTNEESALVCETETTKLFMLPISDKILESYLDLGAWEGKAGAFGYQDGNEWITILSGSESNVVGLPIECFKKCYDFIRKPV